MNTQLSKSEWTNFARQKEAWQAQIARDERLTPTAFRVALIFGRWLNSKTGEAYPSQQTIAAHIGCTDRSVRNALSLLVKRGHLIRLARRGQNGTHRYRIALYSSTGTHIPVDGPLIAVIDRKALSDPEIVEQKDRVASNGKIIVPRTERPFRQTPERTFEEEARCALTAQQPASSDQMDENIENGSYDRLGVSGEKPATSQRSFRQSQVKVQKSTEEDTNAKEVSLAPGLAPGSTHEQNPRIDRDPSSENHKTAEEERDYKRRVIEDINRKTGYNLPILY